MTVALLLSSSTPLNLRSLEGALEDVSADVALVPIATVPLDDNERDGIAELMRTLSVEHCFCIVSSDAPTYDPGFFDSVTDARSSIVDALRSGLDLNARNFFVLMYEWEDVESTRLLAGGLDDLEAFLGVHGGWPPLRMSLGRGGYAQEIYPTLVFEIVSERDGPNVRYPPRLCKNAWTSGKLS